jgi:hypothetical protein
MNTKSYLSATNVKKENNKARTEFILTTKYIYTLSTKVSVTCHAHCPCQ